MFELTYPAWDANGARVTEVKRITLDAGQNLNRFESRYAGAPAAPTAQAAGIKKHPDAAGGAGQGARAAPHVGAGEGRRQPLRLRRPRRPGAACMAFAEADGNVLVVTSVSAGSDVTYYAGAGWDKSGDFPTAAAWDAYVDQAARRLASPVTVTVAAR